MTKMSSLPFYVKIEKNYAESYCYFLEFNMSFKDTPRKFFLLPFSHNKVFTFNFKNDLYSL